MGLSASQARFLQLTARRSNLEYQAQQINFERLQLASKLEAASSEYQDATTNKMMVFSFNSGEGTRSVDVSYANYKNFMNQQQEGLSTTQQQMFLVSSTGNKIIVANREEMQSMIKNNTSETISSENFKERSEAGEDMSGFNLFETTNDDGSVTQYYAKSKFTESDFMIVEDLDDTTLFQKQIQNGNFYFATLEEVKDPNSGKIDYKFNTQSWDAIGNGAISENYDKTDDAEAESKFESIQTKLQKLDKTLELELDQIETEREAIQTEIESVSKVIDDNIESSFKTFS